MTVARHLDHRLWRFLPTALMAITLAARRDAARHAVEPTAAALWQRERWTGS